MLRSNAFVFALSALLLAPVSFARDWVEGTDYALLRPTQQTTVPAGKIEVMEVFSYACPACNGFQPVMSQLRRVLPADVQFVYLPAAFQPAEDWPMFQRAYLTAQLLGIAERTHQGIFDAVWKTGELAWMDPTTQRPKSRLPTIEDAARVYAQLAGVKPETFLATAKSFSVDMKMRAADSQIIAMQVPSTPSIVVNGKYRINRETLKTNDELIELVKHLVAKETAH